MGVLRVCLRQTFFEPCSWWLRCLAPGALRIIPYPLFPPLTRWASQMPQVRRWTRAIRYRGDRGAVLDGLGASPLPQKIAGWEPALHGGAAVR